MDLGRMAAIACVGGVLMSAALAQTPVTIALGAVEVVIAASGPVETARTDGGLAVRLAEVDVHIGPNGVALSGVAVADPPRRSLVIDGQGTAVTLVVDGTPVSPIADLRARAATGEAAALNDLGVIQARAGDAAGSADLYRQAADLGLAVARMNYAWRLWTGDGVAQDRTAAVRYARQAAAQADPAATRFLGVAHLLGEGVPRDVPRALGLLRIAAAEGDAPAARNLGLVYRDGAGVPRDAAEALRWFDRAVELGYPGADAEAAAMRAVLGPEAEAEGGYWYVDGQEAVGPVSRADLTDAIVAGRIGADTLIWSAEMEDWRPIRDVAGLLP